MITPQNKVPALRFPEFDGDWKEKKLSNVASFFSGGTPKSSNREYYNGNIPFIKSGEIGANKTEQFLSEEGLKNSSAKKVKQGDLLYALYGATSGEIAISKVNGAINQAVLCIRAKEEARFIYYFLGYNRSKIINTYLQGGQGNLSAQIVKSFQISFPTLPEQQKIAAFLTAIDTRIGHLERKKTLLGQYKKGLMQRIFSQELRFKDDNGKDFPVWEEKALGEIGTFKNGLNKSKEDFGFGYPFINLMNVFGKSHILPENYDLVNASEKELKAYNLEIGDVLFIRSSVKREGVGEASVVLKELNNTVYSGFLIRFREKMKIFDLRYKEYCFGTRDMRNQILSFCTTSANTNVNQESLNLIRIKIPSLPEQQKIAAFLSAIDDKIGLVADQIEKTKTYKKGLLQQMFV